MALLRTVDDFKPRELRTQDIEMPEFGGTVRIREWMGDDRDAWEECFVELNRKAGTDSIRFKKAATVAASVVDEDGKRIFSLNGDVEKIQRWPATAIERIWQAAAAMNGLGGQSVEDTAKNLPADRNGSGGYSSPHDSESRSENSSNG